MIIKITLIFAIIIALIIALIIAIFFYKFNNIDNIVKVYGKIVKTEKEKITGLMYRKNELKYNEGMLFPLSYKNNSMWMKNTYIPLDVIFLDENMIILGSIKDTIPLSLESISINKKSNNVLEMNAGSVNYFNMKIGKKVLFIEQS